MRLPLYPLSDGQSGLLVAFANRTCQIAQGRKVLICVQGAMIREWQVQLKIGRLPAQAEAA